MPSRLDRRAARPQRSTTDKAGLSPRPPARELSVRFTASRSASVIESEKRLRTLRARQKGPRRLHLV